MKWKIRISASAEKDIQTILELTLRKFGEVKYTEYRQLMKVALDEITNGRTHRSRREDLSYLRMLARCISRDEDRTRDILFFIGFAKKVW